MQTGLRRNEFLFKGCWSMSTYHRSATPRTRYMSLVPYCWDGNKNLSQDNQNLFRSDYEGATYQGHPRKQ